MTEVAHRLQELSDLKFTVHTLGNQEPWDVLIVGFEGEYGHGSRGNGDGGYMSAVMTLVHELWPSRETILDLRGLDYEWGDWIENAFPVERLAIVVSDLCRTGLTSLVKDWMDLVPGECLFDSVEEAIVALGGTAGRSANLVQRDLQARSKLQMSMQAVPLGTSLSDRALLIETGGVWQSSDAGFVRGHALAWLVGWEFSSVIFDFRALQYQTGPEMVAVLALGKRESPERDLLTGMFGQAGDQGYPGRDLTCVLVSDLCREGITRLVQSGMKVSVSDWMFDDLASAVRSLRTRTRKGPGFLPI